MHSSVATTLSWNSGSWCQSLEGWHGVHCVTHWLTNQQPHTALNWTCLLILIQVKHKLHHFPGQKLWSTYVSVTPRLYFKCNLNLWKKINHSNSLSSFHAGIMLYRDLKTSSDSPGYSFNPEYLKCPIGCHEATKPSQDLFNKNCDNLNSLHSIDAVSTGCMPHSLKFL